MITVSPKASYPRLVMQTAVCFKLEGVKKLTQYKGVSIMAVILFTCFSFFYFFPLCLCKLLYCSVHLWNNCKNNNTPTFSLRLLETVLFLAKWHKVFCWILTLIQFHSVGPCAQIQGPAPANPVTSGEVASGETASGEEQWVVNPVFIWWDWHLLWLIYSSIKHKQQNPSNGMTHVFESESRAILHDINHAAFNATWFRVSVSVIFPEEI